MSITISEKWDPQNLSHRYTVSFFKNSYGDEPTFMTASDDRLNSELTYFNVSTNDSTVEAQICAGLCIVYMENQGLVYHDGKTRAECYAALVEHLSKGGGKVLYTADIVDYYFKFSGEF